MENIERGIEKVKEEGNEVRKKTQEQFKGYILASVGLVAGLAWNEAIKSLIEKIFPLSSGGVLAKFIYAIVITTVIILATHYLFKEKKAD